MGETVPVWRWVGDSALQHQIGGAVEHANRFARSLARAVRDLPGVSDAYAAARSVTVVLRPGTEPPDALWSAIDGARPGPDDHDAPEEEIVIEVSYGGADGPDLAAVAAACAMSEPDVVAMHSGATYRVAFFGFMPGFAYLLGLPQRLHVPRLATPRTAVASGSVAIAGPYSGIYPAATPGGWRIIGRADVSLFDPSRSPPAMLAGKRVRFRVAR